MGTANIGVPIKTIFLTMKEIEGLYPLVDVNKFEGLSYFLKLILDDSDREIDDVVPVGVNYMEEMYIQSLLAS